MIFPIRRTPIGFLILVSVAMPLGLSVWAALLNNFAVERADFTGLEIGILQSLREIPGFLAFTAVLVLLLLREQTFAVLALALFGWARRSLGCSLSSSASIAQPWPCPSASTMRRR